MNGGTGRATTATTFDALALALAPPGTAIGAGLHAFVVGLHGGGSGLLEQPDAPEATSEISEMSEAYARAERRRAIRHASGGGRRAAMAYSSTSISASSATLPTPGLATSAGSASRTSRSRSVPASSGQSSAGTEMPTTRQASFHAG